MSTAPEAAEADRTADQPRMGFFTDTTVCIGCKACEVACKEWNLVPPEDGLDLLGFSYDNTGGLGADTWRHVAFIEQRVEASTSTSVDLGMPQPPPAERGRTSADGAATEVSGSGAAGSGAPAVGDPAAADGEAGVRWLMSSDVCKHCTHAACLDVCPTGALFRTEFDTVVVQEDICNGCGYCIPACPYGVIDQRPDDGRAFKCTLCYDRLGAGMQPACAQACPTNSIQYGPLEELRERADERLTELHDSGVTDARLYGADDSDGVGGTGAFFLLQDDPEVYGFPPDPVVTTRDLGAMWRRAGAATAAVALGVALSFFRGRRKA